MLRTSWVSATFNRLFVTPMAQMCLRAGISASLLSMVAIGTAAASGVAFVFEPALGGAFYLLSGALDTLDGAVSRRSGDSSRAGAFLDSLLDRYAELVALLGVLGFYVRAGAFTPLLAFVVLLAGFGSVMASYAQARAEGLGSSCSFGFFERPERMLLLGAGAIASRWIAVLLTLPDFLGVRPVLGVSLLVLAIGTHVTALRRLARGYRQLQLEDE